jgi:hypothetical protein
MSLSGDGYRYPLAAHGNGGYPGMPSAQPSGRPTHRQRTRRGGDGPSSPPPFGVSIPGAAGRRAEALARLVERHLEELHFSFDREPLVDVAGFLIVEGPYRAIVSASDLDAAARLRLALHCLGHLALGHVDASQLSLTYEFRDRWRLPPAQQAREAAADAWADALLAALTAPAPMPPRYQPALRQALRRLGVPRGYARACLARLRTALAPATAEVAG